MKFLSANSYGLAIGYTAILCCVSLDPKEHQTIMPFGKVAGNFAWGTFFLCTAATLLGGVLTNESTGIAKFLSSVLNPIFSGMSLTVFYIALLAITLVLTNL